MENGWLDEIGLVCYQESVSQLLTFFVNGRMTSSIGLLFLLKWKSFEKYLPFRHQEEGNILSGLEICFIIT